jgi:hypothetical protein
MPWQWLANPQQFFRTASVQASGVSLPRLLLRRVKRRTAIAPTRYHASLDAHEFHSFACRSSFLDSKGLVMISRHNGALLAHSRSTLASLLSLSTSLLPLRSSLMRHATPCSGSCSCSAPIILRRQIVPYSAYSAEQSSHDSSQRGLRLGDSFRI